MQAHCTQLSGDEKVTSHNQELKNAGLKVTLPRVKILQLFEQNQTEHLSAEDVKKLLLESGEDVGIATVYRVLTQFESAGLLTKHNFDGSHSVYEMSSDDHHDHMVNMETGEVIEFVDPVIEQRQYQIAEEHGYEIVDHSLILYVKPKT
jgi:Fur family transcriptional regulator, ferric uptake regulator